MCRLQQPLSCAACAPRFLHTKRASPTMAERRSVQIPLKDSVEDEIIEISFDELPDGDEVIGILKAEKAALHFWIDLAIEYYKRGNVDDFVKLMEISGGEASLEYDNDQVENDQMRALDTLAAYYVKIGHRERSSKDKRKDNFTKATLLYTTADKIRMYDQNHLLGRAYFCLFEGNKMDQADQQFNFVINQDPQNIAAMLGKACIAFQKKDFKTALFLYKKAIRLKPDCPPDVRVGIGHCLAKMGKMDKARLAFERTLELDPQNVAAMAALAILDGNTQTQEAVHSAVMGLSRAYRLEAENPVVLNHLANHFFYKGDLEKVEQLAWHAFQTADTEAIRGESCFQLARCFHRKGVFDKAFRYYYQATQFATPAFVLPHFGLGQMYMHRLEFNNAIACFEKILKVNPSNAETLKILGSLYAHTEPDDKDPDSKRERLAKARSTLEKLLEQWPDDIEVLIDLAQLNEAHDPQKSLSLYTHAVSLLREREQMEPPPEMLNNMGALHMAMGEHDRARHMFSQAEASLKSEDGGAEEDSAMLTTIQYNAARATELMCLFEQAEHMYKHILRHSPQYVDCYMRLGCLCRDRGQIYDSSVWFKEAMSVQQTHADAWTLIGNLHMAKHEWGPAQKKFEHIVNKLGDHKDDAYSLVALGNVWLETLFSANRNKDKDKTHADRAINMFTKALKAKPKNMWAANGIGCVLAFKGSMHEARDVFAQVREATADFCDVWVNIAHVYIEQKQYVAAVQMYTNAMKKFSKENDVNLLVYLARAFYKAGKLNDCREMLEKAISEAADNLLVKFNHAFVLQKIATQIMKDDKATLEQVTGAVEDLKIAEREFSFLAANKDETLSQARLVSRTMSGEEARKCSDLLCQATTYLQRARSLDEEEQRQKTRQEEERRQLMDTIAAKEREKEEEIKRKMDELKATRQMYVDMTKNILKLPEIVEEKKSRGGGGGGRRKKGGDGDEFVNDSDEMGDWEGGERGEGEGGERRQKKKKAGSGRKRREEGSGDDEDKEERRRRRKSEAAASKADAKLSAKQSAKVKSRAYLSSDDSSDDARPARRESEDGGESPVRGGGSPQRTPSPPRIGSSDSDSDHDSSPVKRKAKVASDSESGSGGGSPVGAPATRSSDDSD